VRVCSECGHEFVVERRELAVVDGELQEYQKRERRRAQGGAQSYAELVAVGMSAGHEEPACVGEPRAQGAVAAGGADEGARGGGLSLHSLNPAPLNSAVQIEAVVVCVNYSDFLAYTLPANRSQFNNMVVVTDTKDEATVAICNKYNVRCVQTDAFYGGGIGSTRRRESMQAWLRCG
jgi:hypothetical protein